MSFITSGAKVLTNRSVDEVEVYRMAMAQSEKQFGKSIDQLNPQQYSTLASQYGSKDLAEVKNFMNNPNKAYSGPIGPNPATGASNPRPGASSPRPGAFSDLPLSSPLDSKAAGSKNADTASQVTDSAKPKKSLYDWTMDKMNIQGEGAQKMDFKGKTFWEGTKEAGSWFTRGSTSDAVKKIGLGAAGYMGANIAMRGMSGGGVTYNNQGQRDISGIPFV